MVRQIDCFNTHLKFLKYFGVWASENDKFPCYKIYSMLFVLLFIVFYDLLMTVNLFFVERQIDSVVEETLLWFTMMSIVTKTFTFIILPNNIASILLVLESNTFQATNEIELKIVNEAKKVNVFFWKVFAVSSVTSNLAHALTPFILHVVLGYDLFLPECSYDFLSEEWKKNLIYPAYFYQIIGMHFNMWYNVNIDSFFLGLLNLAIAQVDILKDKLKKVTEKIENGQLSEEIENGSYLNLKQCIIHYKEIANFCLLVERTFSVTLFAQFNIASWVICVGLFRLTLPLTPNYFVFLVSYIIVMVLQILIPCWCGHQISDKSAELIRAAYECDWPSSSHRFKSCLRVFVTKAGRPVSVTGCKIFPLNLNTFTAIANSAYSFYTLLRNVQQ